MTEETKCCGGGRPGRLGRGFTPYEQGTHAFDIRSGTLARERPEEDTRPWVGEGRISAAPTLEALLGAGRRAICKISRIQGKTREQETGQRKPSPSPLRHHARHHGDKRRGGLVSDPEDAPRGEGRASSIKRVIWSPMARIVPCRPLCCTQKCGTVGKGKGGKSQR